MVDQGAQSRARSGSARCGGLSCDVGGVTHRAGAITRSGNGMSVIALSGQSDRTNVCPLLALNGHSVCPLVANAAMLPPTIINRRRNHPDVGDKSDLLTTYRDHHRGGPDKGS